MGEEEDPEALRRRLYRPGASEADRLRYLATLPVATAVPEERGAPAPRAARGRAPVLALVLVLVVVGGVALARALTDRPAPSPVGPAAAPVAGPVAGPTPKRILPSSQVVVAMNGLPRTAWRVVGSGAGEVPLDLSAASASGGTLVVLLSSTDERPVGWRALTSRGDAAEVVTAIRPPRDREGATRADVVPYTGRPPARLEVEAPADAFWTLTVAFGARVR